MFPLKTKIACLGVDLFKVGYVGAYKFTQPFLFKTKNVDPCVFSSVSQKINALLIYVILVLTNNFLKLRSFSNTIQMLVSKANFWNLADLPENLAMVLLRKLSMALFALCV